MQALLIEIESDAKAKELSSLLSSMNFVKKLSSIRKCKDLTTALQAHENLKGVILRKKNKAIAKFL